MRKFVEIIAMLVVFVVTGYGNAVPVSSTVSTQKCTDVFGFGPGGIIWEFKTFGSIEELDKRLTNGTTIAEFKALEGLELTNSEIYSTPTFVLVGGKRRLIKGVNGQIRLVQPRDMPKKFRAVLISTNAVMEPQSLPSPAK